MEYTIKVGTDCRTGYFASLRGAKTWATKVFGKGAYIQIFQNDVMVSERQAFGNWVNIEVTEKTEEEKAEGDKESGGCFGENYHTLRAWNRAEVCINELRKFVSMSYRSWYKLTRQKDSLSGTM